MRSTSRRGRTGGQSQARDLRGSGVSLMLRIDMKPEGRVGPGKIDLLERIEEHGSISAAARAMQMSYRRAWELVDELGRCFGRPVVTAQVGGIGGGGAMLTPLGRDLVTQYRAIERKARQAARQHLIRLTSSRASRR
jgi:molybdate transport system regulatory protein